MFSQDDDSGKPFAVINDEKKGKDIVYLVENSTRDIINKIRQIADIDEVQTENITDILKKTTLSTREIKTFGNMWPIPSFGDLPDRYYICGASGSGKSYFLAQYLKNYRKVYPEKTIFLISDQKEDKVIDDIEVIREPLNTLITNPEIEDEILETYKDSIVVFDDIDSIADRKVAVNVNTLKDAILKRGRHYKITCIITSHLTTAGHISRVVLNEATHIVVFPRSGSFAGIQRILAVYCGMNKKQIDKVINLDTRWVMIKKHAPVVILYENGCYFL
jgi:hypothetical protein